MLDLFAELKRRNVFRVAIAYLALAWLVIQVTDIAVPALKLPESLNSIVFYIGLIGFPFALFFAWAFELTPEGLKREAPAEATPSPASSSLGKRINQLTLLFLVLALCFVVIDQYILEEQRDKSADESTAMVKAAPDSAGAADESAVLQEDQERSIAVLPFRNRSANADDAYFVDGIHDDILTQLTRVNAIDKVISRTSVERYRDTELPIRVIAEELAVTTILEGGVQRAGDRVRINMQLIDSHTDQHLWAETYDRELTVENLFAIQSEIALAVVKALEATLSEQERNHLQRMPTDNFEALEQYFLSKRRARRSAQGDFTGATRNLEKAVQLDPDFALAWAELGRRYMMTSFYNDELRDEYIARAYEAVEKAVALDPNLGEAYMSLGSIASMRDNPEEAERYFDRAMQLIPNSAPLLARISSLRFQQGRLEEAVQYYRAAIARADISAVESAVSSNPILFAGLYDEARANYQKLIDQDPESTRGYSGMAASFWMEGRWAEAVPWTRKALAINPYNLMNDVIYMAVPFLFWELGDSEEGYCLAKRNYDRHPESFRAKDLMAYAWLIRGNQQKALEYARRAKPLAVSNHLTSGARQAWLNLLRDEALATDDIEAFRQFYETQFPQLFAPTIPSLPAGLASPAVDLLPVLARTDEEALTERLLTAIASAAQSPLLAILMIPDLLTMRGQYDEAVNALQQAVAMTRGAGWQMLIAQNPNLKPLHNHPGYRELIADLQARADQQRARLRASENPADTCRATYPGYSAET